MESWLVARGEQSQAGVPNSPLSAPGPATQAPSRDTQTHTNRIRQVSNNCSEGTKCPNLTSWQHQHSKTTKRHKQHTEGWHTCVQRKRITEQEQQQMTHNLKYTQQWHNKFICFTANSNHSNGGGGLQITLILLRLNSHTHTHTCNTAVGLFVFGLSDWKWNYLVNSWALCRELQKLSFQNWKPQHWNHLPAGSRHNTKPKEKNSSRTTCHANSRRRHLHVISQDTVPMTSSRTTSSRSAFSITLGSMMDSVNNKIPCFWDHMKQFQRQICSCNL